MSTDWLNHMLILKDTKLGGTEFLARIHAMTEILIGIAEPTPS